MTPVLGLHLQSLEGNPGILPVKEGQAFFQIDHWTIIKVINLENICNDLNHVKTSFKQFNDLIDYNNPVYHEYLGIRTHTEFVRDITIEKYQQLVPQRQRRGLINPLGSIIKIITGNLDHDDALRYDKLISKLNKNQIIVSDKLTLVSQMFDSFINTTETIYNNSVILEERLKIVEAMLNDVTVKQNEWMFSTYMLGLFNIFISSFRTIFIRLSEIETALALSRLSILHQSIVTSKELLQHLKSISKSANLVYLPTEDNLLKLEETIFVKSYVKRNQVTFILEVPLTDNYTYNYYKIYSLPIFQQPENITISIFPEFPYLLAKKSNYLPIVTPCRPLAAGEHFLCTTDNQAIYHEPTCVEQLMEFDNTLNHCKQHQIHLEEIKVQRINTDSWILYSRLKTTLTKQCDNEISKQPIFGTYLITIDEPCDLEIHGIHLKHQIYVSAEIVQPIPLIKLPEIRAQRNLSSARVLNMNGVNFDEIKYMTHALKHSSELDKVLSDKSDFSVNLGYLTFSLLLLGFLSFLLFSFRKKVFQILRRNHRKSCENVSDNFTLREGGVMEPPHPSVLD